MRKTLFFSLTVITLSRYSLIHSICVVVIEVLDPLRQLWVLQALFNRG